MLINNINVFRILNCIKLKIFYNDKFSKINHKNKN